MYYLFSTFLCQDRLTFLGHNLSNPETMCHNVSVSKQPGQNLPNITAYLYFHVTQFPATLLSWLILTRPHLMPWWGSDWQNSLWRGTGGIYERRKCVNCHERVWPHVTNLAWHEGMSRDKLTGADPCRGLRAGGGWPGNCLTRSRPGQCQARGVEQTKSEWK